MSKRIVVIALACMIALSGGLVVTSCATTSKGRGGAWSPANSNPTMCAMPACCQRMMQQCSKMMAADKGKMIAMPACCPQMMQQGMKMGQQSMPMCPMMQMMGGAKEQSKSAPGAERPAPPKEDGSGHEHP